VRKVKINRDKTKPQAYHCKFCGHVWADGEQVWDEDEVFYTSGCNICVPAQRKGARMRYVGRVGRYIDNYSSQLNAETVYVLETWKQEQHGVFVTLQGVVGSFNLWAFAPAEFMETREREENGKA
jgi:hypothetical protein